MKNGAMSWADKVSRFTALDLETYLIEAGLLVPKIVCGSTARVKGAEIATELLSRGEALHEATKLLQTDRVIVGANIAYDLACLIAAEPLLIRPVFRAYEEGRVYDIQIAQALDAIAYGLLFTDPRTNAPLRDPETGKQARYSLAVCTDLTLGRADAKKNDYWRLRYAMLDGVPFSEWPAEAKQYPLDDARNTLEVALAQVLGPKSPAWKGEGGPVPGPLRNLEELSSQCETAFDMHLGAIWGLRTDPARVAALKARADKAHETFVKRFSALGFFKADGKEDKQAIKRAVVRAYGGEGPCAACSGGGKVLSPKTGNPINCKACSGTGLDLGAAPTTPTGGVCADRDALAESGDSDLMAFGDNEAEKIRNTYIPFLEQGIDRPITLRPNVLVSSFRTSYDGLIQLMPREGGVRECFRARGAWCGSPVEYVYCSVDYAALELCTLAQVCLWLFGHSQMAETINASGDPGALHTALAARMKGVTTEEMTAALKSPDAAIKEEAKRYRQAAKPINFGVPGGMGAAKLVITNRKKNAGKTAAPDGLVYPGIRFCILLAGAERCGVEKVTTWRGRPCPPVCRACVELVDRDLRPAYFKSWPEINPYFEWVSARVEAGGEFPCWGTEAVRGGLDFTNGANHSFQNLAASGAKYALRLVTRESYLGEQPDGSPSALAGTRPVFFAHDEVVSEMPRRRAHLAGPRKAEVMVGAMRLYVPDVVISAAPALSEYWAKAAEPTYDTEGNLTVWQGQ